LDNCEDDQAKSEHAAGNRISQSRDEFVAVALYRGLWHRNIADSKNAIRVCRAAAVGRRPSSIARRVSAPAPRLAANIPDAREVA
jgi:hypothetical protein